MSKLTCSIIIFVYILPQVIVLNIRTCSYNMQFPNIFFLFLDCFSNPQCILLFFEDSFENNNLLFLFFSRSQNVTFSLSLSITPACFNQRELPPFG